VRIYARSVHRWYLQTRDYVFAAENVGLSSFASIQRALKKTKGKVLRYDPSRSIEIGTSGKPMLDFY